MNRLILIALILFFITSAVFSEDKGNQNGVPYFTNQDLEKYKTPSDTKHPVDNESADNTTARDSLPGDMGEEQKLKKYVIPYKPYEGTARRIIIPVTFNGHVTAPVLLDTGAPGMHISYSLAERLGIFDKDESMLWVGVTGIGGSIPAIFTILDKIQVGEAEDHFIPTIVSLSAFGDFEGLIGMDFMANYSIQIDTKKHVVVFEELTPRLNIPAGHDETWWRITFRNFKSMRSAWEKYREYLGKQESNSSSLRKLKMFADRQYKEAEELYNRLQVYASKHAVPLEWR